MAPGRTRSTPLEPSSPSSRAPERGLQRAPPAGQVPARHRPLTGPKPVQPLHQGHPGAPGVTNQPPDTKAKAHKNHPTHRCHPSKKNPVGKKGVSRKRARKREETKSSDQPMADRAHVSTAPDESWRSGQSGRRVRCHNPGPPVNGSPVAAMRLATWATGTPATSRGPVSPPCRPERHMIVSAELCTKWFTYQSLRLRRGTRDAVRYRRRDAVCRAVAGSTHSNQKQFFLPKLVTRGPEGKAPLSLSVSSNVKSSRRVGKRASTRLRTPRAISGTPAAGLHATRKKKQRTREVQGGRPRDVEWLKARRGSGSPGT